MVAMLPFYKTSAQPLQELLEIATSNNFELKALEKEYQAALQKAPQAAQLPDPEINAGFFVLPPETRLGPQRVMLGASQMFPWKGTLSAKEAIALSNARAKLEQVHASKLIIHYRVKSAWLKLVEVYSSIDILGKNIELLKSLEAFTLAKTENGTGNLSQVLRVQLKLKELEQRLKLLENRKSSIKADLNKSLGLPIDNQITISGNLEKAELPVKKDSLLQIIQHHPLMDKLSAKQASAQKKIELNALNSKPSFGIGMDYIMVGKRTDLSPEYNGRDILVPKVKVKVPLYRKKYTAADQEQKMTIAALDHRKADLIQNLQADFEKAMVAYDDSRLELDFYRDQIATTKTVIDILQKSYSSSGKNFDELLRMEIDLVNYELKILKAIVKGHMAKIEIERILFTN